MSRVPVWTPATRLDSSGTIAYTSFFQFGLRAGSKYSSWRSYLTFEFSSCETNFHGAGRHRVGLELRVADLVVVVGGDRAHGMSTTSVAYGLFVVDLDRQRVDHGGAGDERLEVGQVGERRRCRRCGRRPS